MAEGYFLTLDFGTGGGRSVIIDTQGEVVSHSYRKWDYFIPHDVSIGREFNPDEFFEILCQTSREALRISAVPPEKILAVSTTSIRHAYVFSDRTGNELYAGPQTDGRGVFTQHFVEEAMGTVIYEITGQWPPLIFAPARLQWFRAEKPGIYEKIAHVMGINDWLVYKLTGKYVTEPSLASASMFLDVRKRIWSKEILDKLNFDENILPEIKNSGDQIGELDKETANRLGLREGTPVVLGGADTQLGMLGSGAIDSDDLGIVAGTSAPVSLVTPTPILDRRMGFWTSCHVLTDKWILESNATTTGKIYEWLKNSVCELEVTDAKRKVSAYQFMDELAAQVPPGSNCSFAILGPIIFNSRELATIRPGLFVFPQPVLPTTKAPFTRKHLIRATLENICYAIKGNCLQLEEASGKKISRVRLTGGMAKSKVWVEMLANVLGVPVDVARIKEGSSLGCAICAAVGVGMYKNLEEAAKALVKVEKTIEPKDEFRKVYEDSYDRWRELYDRAPEIW